MNEYEEQLEQFIKELRTQYRVRRSMHKIKPQALIGNDRTLTDIAQKYCGAEPNWREQVYMQIIEEEEDTTVRLIRSIDMPYGEIVIL